MIAKTKSLMLTIFLFALQTSGVAQLSFHTATDTMVDPGACTPPKNREIFHDYINAEQTKILAFDGKADTRFSPSANEEVNLLLTNTVVKRIDLLQCSIENDTLLNHQNKVRYLRGIENILKSFQGNMKTRKFDPTLLPEIITVYEKCMEYDREGKSIASLINSQSYEIGYSVIRADNITFEKNEGYKFSREVVLLKYCQLYPDQTFFVLKENPHVFFADSLIRVVARKYPGQLYDYVQANNQLGILIRGIKDDFFISTVARMARSKSGQQYFPFLDNIVNGKLTFEEVQEAEKDSIQYYKLLVKTQLEYVERLLNKDTAFAYRELTLKLERRAKDDFVNTINGLHEEQDAVRFQCLQSLTAPELYYLAVLSDGLIYTSSYTRGVYPLMMSRVNNRGDSLLLSVYFDHYRKFISQAAAYNTLSGFLASFPGHDDASNLMKAFVSNLEKTEGLEDGVDVADSYASIFETNKKLANEVLNLAKENYRRNVRDNNERGKNIYNILYKLFLSADSTNRIDLAKELGIPPVYSVPFSSLTDSLGEVVVQMFFYGDEDGKLDFTLFQGMYTNANWKIDKTNKQWVVVRSAKGKPVTIYANIPFDEETGEDDQAQKALGEFFEQNNIHPTVTINRGHSYHAENTIDYMAPTSRIVFMGSCGGFHLIDAILQKSGDAHIIASKQIGKRDINKPFLLLLTEKLRNGADINWLPFWHEFKNSAKVEGFEDYIPPYNNLGAIFIKAYRKAVHDQQ